MAFPLLAVIAAAASAKQGKDSKSQGNKQLALDAVSTALNYRSQRLNREMQIDLANTAHQREVEDLRKAGLNPILSGTGGAGSATPTLQAPQINKIEVPKHQQVDVATAAQIYQNQKALESNLLTQESQRNVNSAAIAKTAAETSAIKADLHKRNTMGNLWEIGENASGGGKKIINKTLDKVKEITKTRDQKAKQSKDKMADYLEKWFKFKEKGKK